MEGATTMPPKCTIHDELMVLSFMWGKNTWICRKCIPEPLVKSLERVDHPAHYNQGKFEVIDVIEDWKLGFNDGNAVKYIARARHKGEEIQDLKKAVWYLNRQIALREKENAGQNLRGGS